MTSIDNGMRLFGMWVRTPVGATLLLLTLGLLAASLLAGVLGRSARVIGWLLSASGVLLALWVLGGVLGMMGFPVRETVGTLGGYLPDVVSMVLGWLGELVGIAAS